MERSWTEAAPTRQHTPTTRLRASQVQPLIALCREDACVGTGGFCKVYRVADPANDRRYAVKRLVERANWSAEQTRQAQLCSAREAELLGQLRHARIPRLHAYDPTAGALVMDYIAGQSLATRLAMPGAPLAAEAALRYARAAGEVLVYLHQGAPAPIIHRDIKPANLLIDTSDRLWVIDFGIAQRCDDPQEGELAALMTGTPGYTPIEQWSGTPTPRSDVYALAATLAELLTGQRPTLRCEPTPVAIRERNPSVTAGVERLVQAGLELEERNRPSAAEFISAIDAL